MPGPYPEAPVKDEPIGTKPKTMSSKKKKECEQVPSSVRVNQTVANLLSQCSRREKVNLKVAYAGAITFLDV